MVPIVGFADMEVTVSKAAVHGSVDSRFEVVRRVVQNNLHAAGDVGAAVAVYFHGELVVDLWGGVACKETGRLWDDDTLCTVFSVTKGLAEIGRAHV